MMDEILDLNNLVSFIENDIFNDYLQHISAYTPIRISDYDSTEWKENRLRTIKITKFVRMPNDNDLDNLCQLFETFNDEDCTISLVYHHTLQGIETFFRIADTRDVVSSSGHVNALSDRAKRVFHSVFPGVEIGDFPSDNNLFEKMRHMVSITSLAGEKNDSFISIENLLNYHDEHEYWLILMAEPLVGHDKLREQTNRFCNYLTEISKYETEQITQNRTFTTNKNAQFSLFVASTGSGEATTDGISQTRTYSNYSVKHMQEQISRSLERIEACKAVGGWKFATYVLSDSLEVAKNVAYQYKAIVRGKESNGTISIVTPWENDDDGKFFKYLEANRHPELENENGDKRDLTNTMSTIDLAHAMNFPRKSVPGFPVTECASFGRDICLLDQHEADTSKESEQTNQLIVGDIWHMRHSDGRKVKLNKDLLASHVFITGSTGSGKSNAVYELLDKLNTKFLVIEPAKGEYKNVFGGDGKALVYGTNYKRTKLLKINPFSFPEGVPLYAHLDRLIEIFNACWPMYAAMPAVLKDAIERAYVDAGWNLQTSVNAEYGKLFPTFVDVLNQIDIVMNESDYSGDSKGDYKGALKTRLRSLTNGIFGVVFGNDELTEKELFDENVIVDLSEIGTETTSLIMGILILKLHEYRMSEGNINAKLRHVTVLEEAHNLLRRTSVDQASDSANLLGKSVEMITNAIAEMRTYGEGFFIVDQAPSALDEAAIRNTNTKIILDLPDYNDRVLVGKSVGLNENQIMEVGKLERGVAVVYQSGWTEAVLCKFSKSERKPNWHDVEDELRTNISTGILLNSILYGNKLQEVANVIKRVKETLVYKSSLPLHVKRVIWEICKSSEPVSSEQLSVLAYELFDADVFFSANQNPSEVDLMKHCRRVLVTNNIGDSISREDYVSILNCLKNERQRRMGKFAFEKEAGGVL